MLFRKMSLSSAAAFSRRMGIGLRAGAHLTQLLNSESQYGSPRQRDAIAGVLEGIEQGFEVSEMMNRRADFFPRLMISLTRAGEHTGKLERTFLTLADHYELQVKLRRDFLSSIAWPGIQLIIGLFVISIVIWVMGVFRASTGDPMEDMLGFGLRGSAGVLQFWCYIAFVAAIFYAAYYGFTRNVGGVHNLIPLVYLIPSVGPSIQTITLSKFTRTLALALGAGLDPIRSVKLGLDSTDSDYYRSGGDSFETAIRDRGDTLAGGLRSTQLFPDPFLQLVEVAELSGTESESIDHLANQYEEQAKGAMKILSGVATGVVWVIVAGTLIFMIFRMASKIFGAYQSVGAF